MRILLVNPPIYDFTAYDFWLKPYGMLRAAGKFRGRAHMVLFDFLAREHSISSGRRSLRLDRWGRGEFHREIVPLPRVYGGLRRRFCRYGAPENSFRRFLADREPFDAVLIQTVMTYWYPGVREVIETVREFFPEAAVVLGGNYATILPEHAGALGPDLVIRGGDLDPLAKLLGVPWKKDGIPLWEAYSHLRTGTIRLTEGCPFHCTYCSVPVHRPGFSVRSPNLVAKELRLMAELGAEDVAFYDDALLHRTDEALKPFVELLQHESRPVRFHTPNGLHSRLVTRETAELMVRAGVETFHLGFETARAEWHEETGSKMRPEDLAMAVSHLIKAGADPAKIKAYVIMGHPRWDEGSVENALRTVHSQGIRSMLTEFSPIPGTPDGEECRAWADLDEPLWHNKTAFTLERMGVSGVRRLKDLCRSLNESLA